MKVISVSILLLVVLMFLFRFQTVSSKVNESAYFYSTCDVDGYTAALWLKDNFPDAATTVATEKPGSWFGVYSGKPVIAETNPIVEPQPSIVATSILDLSYEVEHPLTLIRAYEAKGDISDENCISINSVWRRVSYLAKEGVFVSFRENNNIHYFDLSDLSREIVLHKNPYRLMIKYFNDDIFLTESISLRNDSYPVSVDWALSSLRTEINDVTVYISNFFDLFFSFEKAYVPGSLDWVNPWSNPSSTHDNEWAVVNFTREALIDNYIGVYDEKNEVAFALKFADLPEWGNIGVLASRQIDAVRFQYQFDKVGFNQTIDFTYQVVCFSKSSFPEMTKMEELRSMFDFRSSSAFNVTARNYLDYMRENKVEFLVYDKNRFDSKLLESNILQLVYSNEGYIICRVKQQYT